MKGSELVKLLRQAGCCKVEEGAKHQEERGAQVAPPLNLSSHPPK